MKPNQPDDDAKLRNILREWKVDANLPPRFEDSVWQRIAAAEADAKGPGAWHYFILSIQIMFAKRAVVSACVAVFMAAGLSAGWLQAHEQNARIDASLSARYIQSVDPYQSTHP